MCDGGQLAEILNMYVERPNVCSGEANRSGGRVRSKT